MALAGLQQTESDAALCSSECHWAALVRQFEFIDRYGVIDHGGRLSDGYAAHSRPTPTTRPTAPQADLPSLPALEPVPRPQLPIETENVLPRLLVTAPDQPVELTKPSLP